MNKTIWAPWRIEYILGEKEGGCFLCRMFAENNDRENLLLKRGKTCAVVMNRYPYNSGHLMVTPYRHLDNLSELTAEERLELMDLTAEAVDILKAELHPQGLNLGFNLGEPAGAGLKDHIHQHIVPRWTGDTNFMPVLADTRVMPQALLEQYDILHPLFNPA
ncbi:HIT family protein [Pontiella agarivorans]|uniref:HIT domain-containing protein n=1 Tax=Pontiella agarivorans TaxID=3038953 RepID=A0ABU5MWE1_9BACT|nr:HIT domain-containing protein [Pontiella agarivorans]MDZ8118485.1 HIT domain-containing protein [Pontiella agarivorans]